MAIAFDAVTDFDGSAGTSVSTTHTPVGSTNLFVFVAVRMGGLNASITTLSSVTYGGNAMTQASGYVSMSSTEQLSLWYLAAPPSGAQTVTASWPTTSLSGSLKINTYTGVDQVSPLDGVGSSGPTTSTSLTLTVTTSTDNSWLGGTVRSVNAQVAGANTTKRTGTAYTSIDTNSAQTPPGLKSMVVTQANGLICGVALGFKPFGTTTNSSFFFAAAA